MGKLSTVRVTLRVNDDNPVFLKARPVPFAIIGKYEEALDKLEAGIIRKAEHFQWASRTVAVKMRMAASGSVLITLALTM